MDKCETIAMEKSSSLLSKACLRKRLQHERLMDSVSYHQTNPQSETKELKMDVAERHVLRRKRPILADILTFAPEDQKKYRKKGLLDDTMIGEIMVETTDFGQVFKFLELLSTKKKITMEDIIKLAEEKGESWLADEIRIEILLERQELEIEEYVFREAGVIVHKQWGKSRRFSELDKKELQFMLATRYQAAKEAWNRQLAEVRGMLAQADDRQRKENGRMKGLMEKVDMFLTVQEKRINPLMHDNQVPVWQTRDDPDPTCTLRDYCQMLEHRTEHIMEVTARVMLEQENLSDERKRCLDVLKIEKPVVQLDMVIDAALKQTAEDLAKSRREAALSDQLASKLNIDIKTLKIKSERDLAAMEKQVCYVQMMNRQRDERIHSLEKKIGEMQQELEETDYELRNWKKKCSILEKTRRIGYNNPGLLDKFYVSEGGDAKSEDNTGNNTQRDTADSMDKATAKDKKDSARFPKIKPNNTNKGPIFKPRNQTQGSTKSGQSTPRSIDSNDSNGTTSS